MMTDISCMQMSELVSRISFHRKILIIGGTGTLGSALAEKLRKNPDNVITILSRDEFKLSAMKKRFPDLKYVIGDIRDKAQIAKYFIGVQDVFQCAALKHVDLGEQFTDQFMMTNYTGTKNCFDLASDHLVENFVFFSTDKAVLPINSYGFSKALAENYVSNKVGFTKVKVYRWGNILGSRGSIIDDWSNDVNNGYKVKITDMNMTRFWINIKSAVDFVLDSYRSDTTGVMIPKMKAAKLTDIIDGISRYRGYEQPVEYEVVGIRAGEKIHEVLFSSHEYCMRSDTGPQYTAAEIQQLLGDYYREQDSNYWE